MALKKPKINLRDTLRIVLAVGLALYLVVALAFTSRLAETRTCRGIRIEVADTAATGFVRAAEIQRELGDLYTGASGKPLIGFDLRSIEERLSAIDKIEDVNAAVMTDDWVHVTVHPLRPVARVFDADGSYYVNSSGKCFKADARYTMDVPVIRGHFTESDSLRSVRRILPLVKYIENDPEFADLISMIDFQDPRHIYLIPDIRGQIIELGSVDDIAGKFHRLKRFYREVIPYKGWNFYDTISVKWDGHVVATRARKQKKRVDLPVEVSRPDIDNGDEGIELGADSVVLVDKRPSGTR